MCDAPEPKLFTLEEYNALTPWQQGYYTYMQADWPESKIPKVNPHTEGSVERAKWDSGNFSAMLAVQDGEE